MAVPFEAPNDSAEKSTGKMLLLVNHMDSKMDGICGKAVSK